MDLFDPIAQGQRRAHAAMNVLLQASGSEACHCWVCGWHFPQSWDPFYEVLDDDGCWQPLCSHFCAKLLPAPDVRYSARRFSPDMQRHDPWQDWANDVYLDRLTQSAREQGLTNLGGSE